MARKRKSPAANESESAGRFRFSAFPLIAFADTLRNDFQFSSASDFRRGQADSWAKFQTVTSFPTRSRVLERASILEGFPSRSRSIDRSIAPSLHGERLRRRFFVVDLARNARGSTFSRHRISRTTIYDVIPMARARVITRTLT